METVDSYTFQNKINQSLQEDDALFTNQNVGRQVEALFEAGSHNLQNGISYTGNGHELLGHSLTQPPQVNTSLTGTLSMLDYNKTNEFAPFLNSGKRSWVFGKDRLSWDGSPVASYNVESKLFRCVVCNTTGFLSRIAEHYLGTHANAKVFQCPRCPYSSAWSRCVRMHMSKHHGIQNAPESLWRGQPLLDEIVRILTKLKNTVDGTSKDLLRSPVPDKRYACPKCPYATDRKDLYSRHENIHKDDKPFHCYVCLKMFNRADHVKKHFFRIHKEHSYDISRIRRYPTKTGAVNGEVSRKATLNVMNMQSHCSFQSTVHANHPMVNKQNNENLDVDQKNVKKRPPKSFQCTYCSWRGVDSWCLRRHLNTHIKPFACSLCEYKAARSERLATHILKIHKKHACCKCTFLTDTEKLLWTHVRENHIHSSDATLKCSQCSDTFDSRSDLETHCILIHKKSLLECCIDNCDFRTTDIAILNQHRLEKHGTHRGPEIKAKVSVKERDETVCRYCGCELIDGTSLKHHLQLFHQDKEQIRLRTTSEYPYQCVVCEFTSTTQQIMMEHMRVHSGLTLHCWAEEGCNFCTPFDSVLQEHVFREHQDDDCIIRCPHCGYPCNTKQSFAQHCLEVHHPLICHLCNSVEQKFFVFGSYSGQPLTVTKTQYHKRTTHFKETSHNRQSLFLDEESNDIWCDQPCRRKRKQSSPRKFVDPESCTENNQYRQAISNTFMCYQAHNYPKRSFLYSCQLCQNSHVKLMSLSQHSFQRVWHRHVMNFKCIPCGITYKHRYQLFLHNRKAHNKNIAFSIL
ncbi:zinc finger protein 257-like isoform X3 [Limulus polyphemus]|uniref:Zinc finger protein 257-like isoform X3 n=1 Tax=Limulus polyphemus TaxID=6850 RepID=A0ABM1SS11_LIMPO|nr:zinc finger protein 257-like isoform X3 [Limulus polyphemus]